MSAIGGAKKPQREWFNPFATFLKHQNFKKQIDIEVAEICCELFKTKQMPAWVSEQIDIEIMQVVLNN